MLLIFRKIFSLSLSLHASRKHKIQNGRTKFSRHYINERYVKFSKSILDISVQINPKRGCKRQEPVSPPCAWCGQILLPVSKDTLSPH